MSDFAGEPQEEQWEADIGALLGRMPAVDPPPGFIASAIDHRPLYAGRILVGLLGVTLLALLGVVVTDAAGRSRVAPELDDLAQRHDVAVRAGVLGSLSADVDYRVDTGVDMPDGFERTRNLAAEDLRQAVYARDDQSVSVFVQDGRLRWDQLPADGLTEIDGLPAWVDENRRFVVVETNTKTVTIVGLSSADVGDVLETLPRTGPSFLDRTRSTVNAITGQLGFPDLG
ncbi:MAG: hypothetical protein ACR2QK_06350 [Acidimicrobiales bacterium]